MEAACGRDAAADLETAEELKAWLNGRVGKTQRLADLIYMDTLPRSHIGKVLKKDLRDSYKGPALTG